jgi:CubicO group peptidase (beta-lactamase class C family)
MQKYIGKPLGMNPSTFRLSDRHDIEARLPIMASWSSTDTLGDGDVFTRPLKSATRHIGGTGMYLSASDFTKLLLAMLRNDGTLLSKENIAEPLTPQVKNSSYMADESKGQISGDIRSNGAKVQCNHSLGGVIAEEDLSSGPERLGNVVWKFHDCMGMPKSNPFLKPQVLINCLSGSTWKVKCAAFLARK